MFNEVVDMPMMIKKTIPVLLLALAACGTNRNEEPTPALLVLPPYWASLSTEGVQGELRSAVELSEQKRFADARMVFLDVRSRQPRGSEAYRSLTASTATESLLAGDMSAFREDAGELDTMHRGEVRVPDSYAEVLAIYRALTGQALPVNTPPKLQEWLSRLPGRTAPTLVQKTSS